MPPRSLRKNARPNGPTRVNAVTCPWWVIWPKAGFVIHDDSQAGNVAPASANLDFVKASEARLPKGHRLAAIRADSVSYQADLFNYCEETGRTFAFKHSALGEGWRTAHRPIERLRRGRAAPALRIGACMTPEIERKTDQRLKIRQKITHLGVQSPLAYPSCDTSRPASNINRGIWDKAATGPQHARHREFLANMEVSM